MAQYQYDEGGNMAAYFMLSFLTLILVPLTCSLLPSRSKFPLNRFELDFLLNILQNVTKRMVVLVLYALNNGLA